VYGAQQDSGAVMVPSSSDAGVISFREWKPACAGGESGYLAPDPHDPDFLYGGTVTRCDQRGHQAKGISPTLGLPETFRQTWTLPLVFSAADQHALYFSHQVLFTTKDGGQSWQQVSPDLTREDPGVPPTLDPITAKYSAVAGPRRGVIYSIAPSPLRAELIWVGTDDGLIHVTNDRGHTWRNVTPPELTAWSRVSMIEASHFRADEVFAAVDRHEIEDMRPYIFRTRDGGATWQKIVKGLSPGVYVNAVREDPGRQGLLFAGTETGVFVSFDDGDRWQSLQLNLPTTSMRDFAVHDSNLVVATHGRSFWVLDDITLLRQSATVDRAKAAYLFRPAAAIRIRQENEDGTPLPMGSPVAQNPPAGAVIDYVVNAKSSGPITLEILDSSGKVVRRYSSDDKPQVIDPKTVDIPAAWLRVPEQLSAEPGMHRFLWDLHYPPASSEPARYGRPMDGPWALPGQYTAKLTASGQTQSQPLTVRLDPRVKVSDADLRSQFELAMRLNDLLAQAIAMRQQATSIHQQVDKLRSLKRPEIATELDAFDAKLMAALGKPPRAFGSGMPEEAPDRESLRYLARELAQIEASVESADAAPTERESAAASDTQARFLRTAGKWNEIRTKALPQFNERLRAAGSTAIDATLPPAPERP
jgi:hypothetical protein